jgi:hypothetical protein
MEREQPIQKDAFGGINNKRSYPILNRLVVWFKPPGRAAFFKIGKKIKNERSERQAVAAQDSE